MVAKWSGYTALTFDELDVDEQAACIAAYRVSNQIDAVMAYEQEKESKRASKKR